MNIMSRTSEGKIVEVDNGGARYVRPVGEIGVEGSFWPIEEKKDIKELLADCGYADNRYMWTSDGPETVQESLTNLMDESLRVDSLKWMDSLDSVIDAGEWDDANKDQSTYSVEDVLAKAGMEDLIRENESNFISRHGLEATVQDFIRTNNDRLRNVLKCRNDWNDAVLSNLSTLSRVDSKTIADADTLMRTFSKLRFMLRTYSCWRMYGECSVTVKW